MTAPAAVTDLPAASDCVCCQNGGVLPSAGGVMVDLATVLACCRDCVAALFLDGLAGWLFVFDATHVRFAR